MLIITKLNSYYFNLLKHHLHFVSMADGDKSRQVTDLLLLLFMKKTREKEKAL